MDRPTPDQVLADIVAPALEVLTRPGEVRSVRAWDEREFVMVEVRFGEERFRSHAWQAGVSPHVTWLGKFASDFQDFVAESSLAWGELREYPAEWGAA